MTSATPDAAPVGEGRQGRRRPFTVVRHTQRHLRALLWLRFLLTLRGYQRSWQRTVALVIFLLFLLTFGAGFAAVTGLGYVTLPRLEADHLLFAVLALLWLLWAMLPLMQYSLNEGLDVTKLQAYPLSRAEQMLALLLATILDPSTLALVALYIPVVIGWHASPLAVTVTVCALLLAYAHTVTISQLSLAALMGLLRSRRYRDIALIVVGVGGSSLSLVLQILFRSVHFEHMQSVLDAPIGAYLQWLPPGMAARAILLGGQHQFLLAAVWLGGMALLLLALVFLWARLLEHGITSAEAGGHSRARRSRLHVAATRQATRSRARRWQLIPEPVRAIAGKDLRYMRRDPQLTAALLSAMFPLVLIFLPRLYARGGGLSGAGAIGPAQVLLASLPAIFVVLTLGTNALGLERQGLQTLILFPVSARHLLLGKNLATLTVAITAQTVVTCALGAIASAWNLVPVSLGAGLGGLLIILGCGNLMSVWLPFRVRQMRTGSGEAAAEAGCLRTVLTMGSMICGLLLLVPIAVAVIVPLFNGVPHDLWLTVPACLLYGLAFHAITTLFAGRHLERHVPEILAVTSREA